MGPEKNTQAFMIIQESTSRVVEEQRAQDLAAEKLAELSAAMEQYPVSASVVEPSLVPKLYALGSINIDPLGVAGPNPMSYVDIGREGVSIKAFVAPPHDSYKDEKSGYTIATRVLLLQPHTSSRLIEDYQPESNANTLEFFGLNLFVLPETDNSTGSSDLAELDNEAAHKMLLDTIAQSEGTAQLLVIEEKPVTGETNIFAVRHKGHGIVKFYCVTLEDAKDANPLNLREVERENSHVVRIPLPNKLTAVITQIKTDNLIYKDILNEFSSAINNLGAQRALDGNKMLSPKEVRAIRSSLNSGVNPLEVYDEFLRSGARV